MASEDPRQSSTVPKPGAGKERDLTLLYDIARSRLATQLSFLDSLDTKLGIFLSVGAGIFAVAGAIVAVAHAQWSVWTLSVLAATGAAFGAVAILTICALRLQEWGTSPRPGRIAVALHSQGEREATRLAIKITLALYTKNEPAYKAKAEAIFPASIALAVEALAAAAALASVAHG